MHRLFPVKLQSDGAKASVVICSPHCSVHSCCKPRSVVKTLGSRHFYINRNPKFTSKGFLICREDSPKTCEGEQRKKPVCVHTVGRKQKSVRGQLEAGVGRTAQEERNPEVRGKCC